MHKEGNKTVNKNIIELNGKRYDALSGALLGESKTARPAASVTVKHSKGRNLDGFIRPGPVASAKTLPNAVAVKVTVAAPKKAKKPEAPKKVEQPAKAVHAPKTAPSARPETRRAVQKSESPALAVAKQAKESHLASPSASPKQAHTIQIIQPHQPEHAKTLMGRGSKKPEYSLKPAIKLQAPAELAAMPAAGIEHKRSVASVDPDRMLRAQLVDKHAAVTRFPKTSANHAMTLTAPARTAAHVPMITVKVAPLNPQATHKTSSDIFEAAIASATSHTQPAHRIKRSTRRKILNFASGATALLVVGGFIAFLNIANLQVHVASVQAGFHASLPSYAPVGYAMAGGVKRTGDTVSMVYRSGEDAYTLTQQPSNWDNETLLENTLPLQSNHQTIEVGGRTVYIYDQNNAVWVTGNIRYDLTGNAPLTASDISNLAMSL